MISLTHVFKEYSIDGEIVFTALKDISLTIEKGEYCAIIGPSGSGKSTLMHMVGLLDQPSRGSITVNGSQIEKLNDDELSRLRSEFVGFVFQQFNLIPKLTILENVLLPTVYVKKKLAFDPQTRGMELLERFGIASKASSFPNKISGGQQQRVAIARALVMNPDLILADEPTGNLDSVSGQAILSLLEDLNKNDGITVVLVTHDMAVAKRARRKIKIKDGILC
jgi:ABC-type lipoprotein export system ATPase subunit